MRVAVVIPARDEEACIGDVVREVRAVLGPDVAVIVADNGSADATAAVACAAGAIVASEPVPGYGRACRAGTAAAPTGTDVLVFMDGDGSDRPADIPALLAAIESGAGLALAVRRGPAVEPGSVVPAARFGNWLCGILIRLLWGRRLHDLSPLKAVRASVLHDLALQEQTYGWTVELLAKAVAHRVPIVEVTAGYRHRRGGVSKVSGQLGPSVRAGVRILATIARVAVREPARLRPAPEAWAGLAAVVTVAAILQARSRRAG